ncbi:sigma-54 dependent transcriptional regulator [Chromobacterium sp. IIBBL 290-4]|uniref:sigma-54-dependent transcriptional regulator n=1 Tax=Chromobacterium sp. IIBBL 290-4 TaxID=2953890 RepID=UPI0020B77CC4|nr:sigma-54 dependent transcriptional regulator [Chromobacterium sp. IIBBL 290-4]UTH75039.1 sigma-54 dependent transcriptional regulator [Chromobacterium sp. IIBBL 290-4]
MNRPRLLLIEDDADVALAARLLLRKLNADCVHLPHPSLLDDYLAAGAPDVVLLDMNYTPGAISGEEGMAVLRRLRALPRPPQIFVLTAYADVPLAVAALKQGASDFITKPWDNQKLFQTVDQALRLATRGMEGMPEGELLGQSRAMQALRAMIANVGPTEANVLILGENGVGKELVARALHLASLRQDGPFQSVDMGALPESTFDSELFGHRKGAFTDARSDREGRFQAAASGTLFLDEIGNLPLANQAKLLTALERRQITPLGADRPLDLNVRVLSATNLEEEKLHDPQHFRRDLLFRLNTIVLRVPPLRARSDDILPLARHYLRLYAEQYRRPLRELTDLAADALLSHGWPGNVRALRHACERAVILSSQERYQADDFDLSSPARPLPSAAAALSSALNLEQQEKQAITQALQQFAGNVSHAAKQLGLSRAALYRRMEKHGL